MTRLSDANTSAEIELSRYFRPWTEKKDLLVLVEGDEDVFFWKKVLEYAKDKYARIDVHTLKLPDVEIENSEVDRKGKRALMENVRDLGPSKVVAVDMDYDELVNGYHSYSTRIGTDPCVLHTIYYSMENHKLYPDVIKNYVVHAVKENPSFDFEGRIADFSRTIASYLLLVIVGERKRANNTLTEEMQNRLSIKGLRADIAEFKFSKDNYTVDSTNWTNYMKNKYGDLMACFQKEIQELKDELAVKGYMENDYWKLLQGHSLAGYMLRAIGCVVADIEKCKEKDIVNRLTDKKFSYSAIMDYRKKLGMDTSSIHDFVACIFVKEPFLSDKDSGLDLIYQQIDKIPD